VDDLLALIVEDDEDAASIFARALQDAGFESEIVRAGDEALTWLAEMTPAVVVLDMELPHVPGVEILRRIRADARLAKTCVIVATAYPDLTVDLKEEADLVLIKPVGYGQLRDLATCVSAQLEASK
jgi:DNA-binding response OmpR family regulator